MQKVTQMKTQMKTCIIARYDKTIKQPPFETIEIARTKILDTERKNDEGGVIRADRLRSACTALGYHMKFYTLSREDGVDYEIVVY